jgi:hypothetical protein
MKRMSGIIYAALIILIIPFSMVAGQDKKSEQKIKIIVDDGSGTKVIIDTVFKDSSGPDSIRLKDGNVIYLKHFTITASTDRKEEGNEKTFDVYVSDNDKKNSNFDQVSFFNIQK